MSDQALVSTEKEMRRALAVHGINTRRPSVARIYDCLLGGKDNFAPDRQAAELILKAVPEAAQACWQNRWFLGRVVRYLAAKEGVRQFIDIGSGLPTRDNVHEMALRAAPDARVVYVDNDRVVTLHADALLKASPRVQVVEADLRSPGQIIDAAAKGVIDFSKPVAVLLFAILHFLSDDEHPGEIVRSLTQALVPGSFVALSHITAEGIGEEKARAAQEAYKDTSAPVVPRSPAAITRFFDGLDLVGPGVTDIRLWRPDKPESKAKVMLIGGVGKVPGLRVQ